MVKRKGVDQKFIGPVNFSTNEACGLLVEGFDSPPMLMMTYNPPYYVDLIEKAGFTKQIDLIAWHWDGDSYDDKSVKVIRCFTGAFKTKQYHYPKSKSKKFKEEAAALREVYNSAWDQKHGFVPMTDEEFDYTRQRS